MFNRIAKYFRRDRPQMSAQQAIGIAHRIIRAKYDAAQTTADNRNHWANSDNLSARAANDPGVRATLRNRSRYEVANNSYARGMSLTLANDTIGSGPRLQMVGKNKEANRIVEKAFLAWSNEVDLASKLRTMRLAKFQDGEAFALLATNPNLTGPVKLDVRLFEADQIATPAISSYLLSDEVDGIKFDAFGNPLTYSVLKSHPGESGFGFGTEAREYAAEQMIHWFRMDRPGQARAVPELTAALPLFAMLRDFTIATLDAAKLAATMTAVLKTMSTGDAETVAGVPFEEIEFARNMLLTLPAGHDISQVKAEHPNSTYEAFVWTIMNEIARCLNMPLNVAMGNSSKFNYASGRLDQQVYFKSVDVERAHCEQKVLDRIFGAWLDEALLIPNYLPLGQFDADHMWFWDGREHVDPSKEATATTTNLANGTTSRRIELARQKIDIDDHDEQAAADFGVTLQEYRKALFTKLIAQPQAQVDVQQAAIDNAADNAAATEVANAA